MFGNLLPFWRDSVTQRDALQVERSNQQMNTRHTLFAFNILLPAGAAAPLPGGMYDAAQQIWVGAVAAVAWSKQNLQCGQRYGSAYSGGGYARCWRRENAASCKSFTDAAATKGCIVRTNCATPEGDPPRGRRCSEVCCPNGITP